MSWGIRRAEWLGRRAPYLVAACGILAAVGATYLNLRLPSAADRATGGGAPGARGEAAPPQLPAFSPLGEPAGWSRRAEPHTVIPHRPRVDVVRYTVQSGDAVFSIASKFGLKPETILWGNYDTLRDDPHLLRPGQELNILPVDGVYYAWQAGDTAEKVAEEFGVEPEAIVDWPGNHLASDAVEPGTWVVVPGGRRPFQQWHVPTIARGRAGVGAAFGPGGCSGDYSDGAVGTGGFIWPTANRVISGNDYWSGHLAIDIAAGVGDAVLAADSGVVVFAGWSSGGYGNVVVVDHGNGWQTLYAHLSSVRAACGQNVSQGQLVGLAGSTGNSTGPHLHFETRYQGGFVNPWYVLP